MRVGSLFSGIGGIDLGLERAGHRIVFQCESDPYRRRVLARHWPEVPCFEDVCEVATGGRERQLTGIVGRDESGADRGRDRSRAENGNGGVDLLCGGFPCQDLSVAGRRAGFRGERSSLFFEFARIADALLGPGGWVLIENVPGLLSSNGGRDFAVLLATLADLGFHDLAWRVLDSRYLGVPQRRRRVFILARRARGRRASEVLLEPESGGGDFEASRETRARPAGSAQSGPLTRRYGKGINTTVDDGSLHYYVEDFEDGTLTAAGQDGGPPRSDRNPLVCTSLDPERMREAPRISRRVDGDVIAVDNNMGTGQARISWNENPPLGTGLGGERTHPGGRGHVVFGAGDDVGRCSFDPKPDSPRYAACGDAVTVNVAEWIGMRLKERG